MIISVGQLWRHLRLSPPASPPVLLEPALAAVEVLGLEIWDVAIALALFGLLGYPHRLLPPDLFGCLSLALVPEPLHPALAPRRRVAAHAAARVAHGRGGALALAQ